MKLVTLEEHTEGLIASKHRSLKNLKLYNGNLRDRDTILGKTLRH